MTITSDLSILTLIANASWVVKIIILILIYFTLESWYLIARKWLMYKVVERRTRVFEELYHESNDVANVFSVISRKKYHSALESVFMVGVSELKKVARSDRKEKSMLVDNIRRAMSANLQKEVDNLERGLNKLATIGSVSPYIGLLGTVWGIMHAFRGLANVSQATLSHVAPGIAEALVATAIGLFAAIPAVLAYNSFSNRVARFISHFEAFIDEFQNVVVLHLR